MLTIPHRVSLYPVQPESKGFFDDIFQCCSPVLKQEHNMPMMINQRIRQQHRNTYNTGYYNQTQNIQQQHQINNIRRRNNSVPAFNTLTPTTGMHMVIETPCVITNQTSAGDIIQTPGLITQKVQTMQSVPSLASQIAVTSTVGESRPTITAISDNQMFVSTMSADHHNMLNSTTYDMKIFDSRINIQKSQLKYLTQIAYQHGYQKGLNNGKKASDKEMQQKLSRLYILNDKQSRLKLLPSTNVKTISFQSNSASFKTTPTTHIKSQNYVQKPMSRVQTFTNTPQIQVPTKIVPQRSISNVIIQKSHQINIGRR